MTKSPEDVQCPACGYYCNGKGGFGCIDKPALCRAEKDEELAGSICGVIVGHSLFDSNFKGWGPIVDEEVMPVLNLWRTRSVLQERIAAYKDCGSKGGNGDLVRKYAKACAEKLEVELKKLEGAYE